MFKKIIAYGFFGVLTTVINIITFAVLEYFNVDYKISVVIAWLLSVIFAYITNKKFVFKTKTENKKDYFKEFYSFIIVRVLSLGFDLGFMIIMIDFMNINNIVAKIISNVIVVIVNYIASELFIFKKK